MDEVNDVETIFPLRMFCLNCVSSVEVETVDEIVIFTSEKEGRLPKIKCPYCYAIIDVLNDHRVQVLLECDK